MTNPYARPDLSYRDVDDNVLVHDPESDMIHVLNREAGRLLRLTDGTRDIDKIIRQFAEESAIGIARARDDVTEIMSEFLRLGLIHTTSDES